MCTETQSACLPACLPGGPCCTCKHRRVMGSSHMLRASPGRLGRVYATGSRRRCVYACAFLCVFMNRACSKGRGTDETKYSDYFHVACSLISACVCVCCLATWKHLVPCGLDSTGIVSRCVCVFWTHCLFVAEPSSFHMRVLLCCLIMRKRTICVLCHYLGFVV